jgi:hypothetical protein
MVEIIVPIAVALITGIVGPSIVAFINKKTKSKQDPIADALYHGTLVTHKLEKIQELLECDRIWLTQFHNGGHFYPTGKSIQKFSIIYELVSPEAHSIQHNFQNIPINLFSKSINYLLEHNIISIPDFKDESCPTYGLKYIAQETGSKSSYGYALKTIDNKFIGVLGIDFTKKKCKLSEEEIAEISMYATQIASELHNHLQSK